MRVRTRLSITAVLLAVVPLLAAVGYTGYSSFQSAEKALYKEIQSNLVARQAAKKVRVEAWFRSIANELKTLAFNQMTVDAMADFSNGLQAVSANSSERGQINDGLQNYYQQQFLPEFSRRNSSASQPPGAFYRQTDDTTRLMQYRYIIDNSHPLGEKDRLNSRGDGSEYDSAHQRYHPAFRYFLQQFGFYDIFLVDDRSGKIVYSVFKELDFATSLHDGPFAATGLGQVFKRSLQQGSNRDVVAEDFAPHSASYNDHAAFMATPVLADGQRIGTLIFQMPIDRINGLMTYERQWKEAGLGESGETYLVGPQGYMRNDSRFLLESRSEFLASLEQAGIDSGVRATIDSKSSTIGLMKVKMPGVQAALSGQSGFDIYPDYRGVPVMSAYTPLDVMGMRWALLSDVDEAEALGSIAQLKDQLQLQAGLFTLGALVIAVLVGLLTARSLTRPMQHLSDELERLEAQADLSKPVPEQGDHELRGVARAFNRMLERCRIVVSEMNGSSNHLTGLSDELNALTADAADGARRQSGECHAATESAELMGKMTSLLVDNANEIVASNKQAHDAILSTHRLLDTNVEAVANLTEHMVRVEQIIDQLSKDSDQINHVLDLVNDIASQTNLLALNAAIEAARAGEQGRGFAVVSDEVRTLASRTSQAIEQIAAMLNTLHEHSQQALQASQAGKEATEGNVVQAQAVRQSLDDTIELYDAIQAMTAQMATASGDQQLAAQDMVARLTSVEHIAASALVSTDGISVMSEKVDENARLLDRQVHQFTV